MKRAQKIAPITSCSRLIRCCAATLRQEILPFCAGAQYRRHQLFADGFGPAHRQDDRGAHRSSCPQTTGAGAVAISTSRKLSRNLRLVELLREIGKEHGVEPGVVAVAWTLRHPAITAAIVARDGPIRWMAYCLRRYSA